MLAIRYDLVARGRFLPVISITAETPAASYTQHYHYAALPLAAGAGHLALTEYLVAQGVRLDVLGPVSLATSQASSLPTRWHELTNIRISTCGPCSTGKRLLSLQNMDICR